MFRNREDKVYQANTSVSRCLARLVCQVGFLLLPLISVLGDINEAIQNGARRTRRTATYVIGGVVQDCTMLVA